MGKLTPSEITRFLGLNESQDGETNLQLGESPYMVNWRITDNQKLKKAEGYEELFESIAAKKIQGTWYGSLNGVNHFLFACNGYIYLKSTLSGTQYDSLDTATYTNVDVVKTTAIGAYAAGTTGIDGATIVKNSLGSELTEIAQANIDLLASVGKYYYHTDKTIWLVVEKGLYADIAAARTGLGTSTIYYRLGTLTDDKTSFFVSNNILYIQNGHEFKKWTGTGAIAAVTGYRNRRFINAPPTGGGTLFEEDNLINGLREGTFTPDGVATEYILSSFAVTSVDYVYINEVLKTVGVDYSVTLTAPAKVTFTVAPPGTIQGSIRIGFTQGTSNGEIEAQYYNMFFGGANDTRVFLWGKNNRYYYSGIGAGIPNVEYFPSNGYVDTDANGYKVTDIVRQYDRQIIFTNKPEAYYSYYDTITDVNGVVIPSFPLYRLNSVKGMIAPNQTQIINNNPYTINDGVYNWVATDVRDERNANYISLRVQPSLDNLDLTTAITCDWEKMGEYWLCVGNTVIVHQYKVDSWFKLELNDTPTCFIVIGGKMYFGTDNGQIMMFDNSLMTFNGVTIEAVWEMGFYDVGVEWLRKFTNTTYISLYPETKSWVEVYYATNKDEPSDTPIDVFYANIDFDDIDFDDFTFLGNYNPQPFKLKTKAKKWTYFKLILKNTKANYGATVISINLLDRIGGRSK